MDRDCPDGMDCPYWPVCQDSKPVGDDCPLLDREDNDKQKPLDKLIWEW